MLHSLSNCRTLILLTALLLIGGCGSSAGPLVPVTGAVHYKGQPLQRGTIVFIPDASKGTHGPLAHADIQPGGRFVLRTEESSGAVAGWHRVTIIAVDASNYTTSSWANPRNILPEKYSSPDLSGLIREVKLGQDNVFQIELD